MMRWLILPAVLTILPWYGTAAKSRVNREAVAVLEKKFDRRVEAFNIDDPFFLLGSTRGVYLENYGVVLTTELNLVASAVVTPFRPALSKEQIEKLRVKKVARVGELRKIMRLQMVDSATALKEVPPEEWIVVGVTLFYYSWEDTAGLPSQILMQAKRQSLLDFEAGRIDSGQLESLTRVEEI